MFIPKICKKYLTQSLSVCQLCTYIFCLPDQHNITKFLDSNKYRTILY